MQSIRLNTLASQLGHDWSVQILSSLLFVSHTIQNYIA
jgi:hypothetical protein